jgi:hypothetical protein
LTIYGAYIILRSKLEGGAKMKCRKQLPANAGPATALESYTCWRADCGCLVEIEKGETVWVVPGLPGAFVEQGERGGHRYHYCSDIEVED